MKVVPKSATQGVTSSLPNGTIKLPLTGHKVTSACPPDYFRIAATESSRSLQTSRSVSKARHRDSDDIVVQAKPHRVTSAMLKSIAIVNLEDGFPSVEQARSRLTSELQIARRGGSASPQDHSRVRLQRRRRRLANRLAGDPAADVDPARNSSRASSARTGALRTRAHGLCSRHCPN